MADLHIEKYHNLDLITARTQAKKWLSDVQSRLGLDIDYHEGEAQDTATIKKSGVDARAVLDDTKITFEADLGFFAKPLKGVIQDGIEEGLDKYFM